MKADKEDMISGRRLLVFATTVEYWMSLQAQRDLSIALVKSQVELSAIRLL